MLTRLYLTTGISPAKITIRLPPRKAVLVIESDEEDLVTSDDDSDIDRKRKHLTDTESEAEEMPRQIKHCKRAKKLWSISGDDAMSKLPKKRDRCHTMYVFHSRTWKFILFFYAILFFF